MKRKIISLTFILLVIITILFSCRVMAAEDTVITSIGVLDLSALSVIQGTTPKDLEYENEQFTLAVEWYNTLPDPIAPDTQYIKGNTKVTKFNANDFDTAYTCRITLTPKVGYKFEKTVNDWHIDGLLFEMAVPEYSDNLDTIGVVDGKFVINIYCKALKEYKVRINSASSKDVTVEMDGKTMNPGDEQKIYEYKKNEYVYVVEAKEGYAISKIEYTTKNETYTSLAVLTKTHKLYIVPEDNVEILVTTEPIIESVEVIGGTDPIIGEIAPKLDLKVPDSANYKVADYYWYNVTDKREMLEGEKFEEWKQYSIYVILRSNARFTYSDMNNFSPLGTCNATIDGQSAKVESVTKEDTNYYLVFSSYEFHPNLREYKFIDNTENQTYTIGKNKILTFVINADYSVFKQDNVIFVENTELTDKDYTHKEGGQKGTTVITITEEFMNKLDVGEHYIDIYIHGNGYALTYFKVDKNKDGVLDSNVPTTPEDNKDTETPTISGGGAGTTPEDNKDIDKPIIAEKDENKENEKTEDNKNTTNSGVGATVPQTGDNIIMCFIIAVISVVGIATIVLIKRNKK